MIPAPVTPPPMISTSVSSVAAPDGSGCWLVFAFMAWGSMVWRDAAAGGWPALPGTVDRGASGRPARARARPDGAGRVSRAAP